VGRFSPWPAQLSSASAQSSWRSRPAPLISTGRCQVGPGASWTPLVSLTFSRAGNRYAPDPLPRTLRSNPSPFLCSSFAPLVGAILVDRSPLTMPQRCPAESPLLRHLAPSRTEMSPRTTARVWRYRVIRAPPQRLGPKARRQTRDMTGRSCAS
jgi:hypothetical protein